MSVATSYAARGETPRRTETGPQAPGWQGETNEHIRRYVSEEQHSQTGCMAGRMQRGFRHGLLHPSGRSHMSQQSRAIACVVTALAVAAGLAAGQVVIPFPGRSRGLDPAPHAVGRPRPAGPLRRRREPAAGAPRRVGGQSVPHRRRNRRTREGDGGAVRRGRQRCRGSSRGRPARRGAGGTDPLPGIQPVLDGRHGRRAHPPSNLDDHRSGRTASFRR